MAARTSAGGESAIATQAEFDGFRIDRGDPLAEQHRLLGPFVGQALKSSVWEGGVSKVESVKALLKRPAGEVPGLMLAVTQRLVWHTDRYARIEQPVSDNHWPFAAALSRLLGRLLKEKPALDEPSVRRFIRWVSRPWKNTPGLPWPEMLSVVERYTAERPLDREMLADLQKLRRSQAMKQNDSDARDARKRLDALLRDAAPAEREDGAAAPPPPLSVDPNEPWTRKAAEDLAAMPPRGRGEWLRLLEHAATALTSKPAAKWMKKAAEHVDAIGRDAWRETVGRWFAQVGQPGGRRRELYGPNGNSFDDTIPDERNADVLKGLAWTAGACEDAAAAQMLGDLAETCFRKIPNHGARCPKVGNACLVALAAIPGPEAVAQLTRLQMKAKKPSISKQVARAITSSAEKQGMTPEDLEESSVPTYGLGEGGVHRRTIGPCTAELRVSGGEVELHWTGADGKTRKSVPAAIKEKHAKQVKEVEAAAKELKKMLPAHAMRVERLMGRDRDWSLADWRQRFIDHPLIGLLGRRLIWRFGDAAGPKGDAAGPLGIWQDSQPADAQGRPIKPKADARVRLWHPIASPAEEVLAWRRFLEDRRITQPFKQAHREVYVLTDAERTTRTYSNRFAAHILRQHQFMALANARGWKYQLMGTFDFHSVPTLELPHWKLRVEFWVDAGGVDGETSASSIYLHISTDQVRFYEAGGTRPMRLDRVPPLAFTEVMRDVDLFVGVASVGNDPTWRDRGRGGIGTYWQEYSFGDLSATARTRRDVLERLIPRLKIRDRASLTDRYLVVRGDLRTYKIHLGSGNILMEPNDQYLCIVPDSSPRSREDDLFLPFEGDPTLAVILSKAFLLADDKGIKDETIARQINNTAR